MNRSWSFRSVGIGIVIVGLLYAVPVWANTITYVASGSSSDGSLAASAVFVTSAGQIQITLTNTLAASVIRSAGQALSDITFTLSNAPGTLGTKSASGQLGNLDSTNHVTYATGSPVRWLGTGGGNFNISGSTITLETIGGGKPNQMIIPSLANGAQYTNVNNGFSNFVPYNIGAAMFTLNLSGVTAGTTITSATFSFGTGPDTSLPGMPQVPEPISLLLLGSGLLGSMRLLRRKVRR